VKIRRSREELMNTRAREMGKKAKEVKKLKYTKRIKL
jgi:hypothetical protein